MNTVLNFSKRFCLGILLRLVLGGALVIAALNLIAPHVYSWVSEHGIVNAPRIVVRTPIGGLVLATPPEVGAVVQQGQRLTMIRNPRAERSSSTALAVQVASIRERLAAIERQLGEFKAVEAGLRRRVERYQTHYITRETRLLQEARAQMAASEARRTAERQKLERATALFQEGIAPLAQRDLAQAEYAAMTAQTEQIQAYIQRLQGSLQAARSGVFVSEIQNEGTYAVQRLDELQLRRLDLWSEQAELAARQHELEKDLALEQARLESTLDFEAVSPRHGVVLRRHVVQGETVSHDAMLLEVLDCTDIFVEARVSNRASEALKPGDAASVQLLGSRQWIPGKVRLMRGSATKMLDPLLAAEVTDQARHLAQVLIDVDVTILQAVPENFCQVGRPVVVHLAR